MLYDHSLYVYCVTVLCTAGDHWTMEMNCWYLVNVYLTMLMLADVLLVWSYLWCLFIDTKSTTSSKSEFGSV